MGCLTSPIRCAASPPLPAPPRAQWEHPDLAPNLLPVSAAYRAEHADDNGHGTHVAGIIGAVSPAAAARCGGVGCLLRGQGLRAVGEWPAGGPGGGAACWCGSRTTRQPPAITSLPQQSPRSPANTSLPRPAPAPIAPPASSSPQVGHNGIGVAGVALRARLLPCKALDASGWGMISKVVECISICRWAGAAVLACYGGVGGCCSGSSGGLLCCRLRHAACVQLGLQVGRGLLCWLAWRAALLPAAQCDVLGGSRGEGCPLHWPAAGCGWLGPTVIGRTPFSGGSNRQRLRKGGCFPLPGERQPPRLPAPLLPLTLPSLFKHTRALHPAPLPISLPLPLPLPRRLR